MEGVGCLFAEISVILFDFKMLWTQIRLTKLKLSTLYISLHLHEKRNIWLSHIWQVIKDNTLPTDPFPAKNLSCSLKSDGST